MSYLLRSLTLNSGPSGQLGGVTLQPGAVTVFVGPNHSGKSLLLREIKEDMPRSGPYLGKKVLKELSFNSLERTLQDALRDELMSGASEYSVGDQRMFLLRMQGGERQIPKHEFDRIIGHLNSVENLRRELQPWGHNQVNRLSLLLGGTERLTLLNETGRGNLRDMPMSVHGVLFQDDTKRSEFQRITKDAFGWHFAIDPTGDSNFRVAISDTAVPQPLERSLSNEALDFFRKCTGIEVTSDGVRAYSGMIAAVIASEAKMILIDEPEAFLHPALSTSLAKELGQQAAKREIQLMVATHSAPFVMGCVQAAIDLTVVRLTYRQGHATSRVLSQTDLTPLMRDPLLRSSGAINGIFYEAVVVTEADRDRAFYDEINHRNVTFANEGIRDCLFLNAQNWQTTARIVGPLRRLGVAAAAIVDLDIVSNDKSASFQTLLGAAAIPEATRRSLGQLRGDLRTKIGARKEELKRNGISILTGSDRQDMDNLSRHLAEYGIFVVSVGEVEGWLPQLHRASQDKRNWLSETFEAMGQNSTTDSYVRPGADDVWEFMRSIGRWLSNPARLGIPEN